MDNIYEFFYPSYKEEENFEKSKKDDIEDDDDSYLMKLIGGNNDLKVNFAKDLKEKISDVKGIDEVIDEIEQLIRMIKDPNKFRDAGAKLHKGILLCGKPGTGKTLIARAIAGESGVNFLYLTGSDFDEVFVGVGATRVRKLFKMARKNAPCIIFIDEIDSLLTKSRRMSMEHSSSRATINQFLSEMDGFDKMEDVFVIGATNHDKDLDSAAIRPGRFDKKIHINIPDEKGRLEIIDYYLEKIKIKKSNIDAKIISKMTPGFTGAEIQNLVNMSIINAINEEKDEVNMEDVGEARDRILMGISKKNFVASDMRRFSTSLHEAGHTLICYLSPICKKTLHKLTIIPRGPAEGVTFMLPDEDAIESKEEFLSSIDTAMGGHVAEELWFGKENTRAGCSSDLNKATKMAEVMVKNFGMFSTDTGYIYVGDNDNDAPEKVSENYKAKIDDTVKVILKDSHDRVFNLLKTHANDLKNISQKVFQYDTLTSNLFIFYILIFLS